MISADELIAFEREVARRYEAGEIRSPVHLSGGNETILIDLFEYISREDWVLSTWRNHYHALLHGIPADELMRQIMAGRSMYINSKAHRFYASSIAGGVLSIAVGLGLGIKRAAAQRAVWCFVGDMVAMTGAFDECARYAYNFKLPVTFVVEDNGKSVNTVTSAVWGAPVGTRLPNCFYYQYKLTWPHHGTGKWIPF